MCGIAGYVGLDIGAVPSGADQSMRTAIRYRGLDSEGEWTDGEHVRLFHSRLSIIDLPGGMQPLSSHDGRYTIVFNGEIYNYVELRAQYRELGARGAMNSDTEVIIEGYRLKGSGVCRDLNGMFAFAIWDAERRELFLARDRLGKKPLVWTHQGGMFWFASTLDAFAGTPNWTGRLSAAGIALYRELASFPDSTTIYEQARSLPAACYMLVTCAGERIRTERYWSVDYARKSTAGLNELMDEYGALLTDAIRLRLRADVPIALTFSGGVDSGTIAAICAKELGNPLPCFTVDYHTPEDPSAEVALAERVSRRLGLPWRHIQFDYHRELLPGLRRVYAYFDQPSVQLALVYAYHLYEAIKPNATAVLSGNAADELFTGYIGDEVGRRKDLARNARGRGRDEPPLGQAYYMNLAQQAGEAQADPATGHEVAAVLERIGRLAAEANVDNHLDLLMHHALTCGTVDSNYRIPDISGLAAQVEIRSPFLDYRLVEFAARMPHEYKIGNPDSPSMNKYLPKLFYERLVGKDIAWEEKRGMGYNLKWNYSIVQDPEFVRAFEAAGASLESAGISAERYRAAHDAYCRDRRNGVRFPPTAGPMMSDFMLAIWLESRSLSAPEILVGPHFA